MADIINSVDRSLDMYIYDLYIYIDISLLCEPNDAVRAVAVAKRREYIYIYIILYAGPDPATATDMARHATS